MRYINKFSSFNSNINEGLLSNIKDFVLGVKTDDDRLIKTIIKNINTIELTSNNRYDINFNYDGYRFTCNKNSCEIYGNEVPYNNKVVLKSKFIYKFHDIAIDIIDAKNNIETNKKRDEDISSNNKELLNYIDLNGGLEELVKYMTGLINDSKGRLDIINDNTFGKHIIIMTPTNTNITNRPNFLIIYIESGKTKLSKSYAAFSNYREYDGILSKSDIKKVIDIIKPIISDRDSRNDDLKSNFMRKINK